MPEETPSPESSRGLGALRLALAAFFVVMGAGLLFVSVLAAAMTLDAARIQLGPVVFTVAIVALTFAAFGAAIGLGRHRDWGLRLGWLASPGIFVYEVVAQIDDAGFHLSTGIVLAIAAFLYVTLLNRRFCDYMGADAPLAFELRPANVLLHLGLAAVAGAMIYFVAAEVPELRQDLRMSRWKSQCEETGNVESCGRHALWRMRYPDDVDEMKSGFRDLRKLCRQGSNSACFKIAHAMAPDPNTSYVTHDRRLFWRTVTDRAAKACEEGDADGCLIVAQLGTERSREERTRWSEAARDVCRDEGGGLGCLSWGVLSDPGVLEETTPEQIEAAKASCRAGFPQHCAWLFDQKHADDEFIAEAFRASCDHNRGAMSCGQYWAGEMGLENDKPHDERYDAQLRQECWDGSHYVCHQLLESGRVTDDDDPHADAVRAAYRLLGHRERPLPRDGDLAYYGDEIEEADYGAACDAGHLSACFAEGIRLLNGDEFSWTAPLPDAGRLEQTLGKACDGGMNVACMAYGLRLIDRPLDEAPVLARGNALLTRSCEDGLPAACWSRSFAPAVLEDDFDDLLETSESACRGAEREAGGPCRTYAALRAFERGFAPWVMERRVAAVKYERLCQTGVLRACDNAARRYAYRFPLAMQGPIGAVAPFDAASRLCLSGDIWTCDYLTHLAEESYGERGKARLPRLREKVCEETSHLCERP